MDASIDYTVPGPLTGLDDVNPCALEPLTADPAEICRTIPPLVVQPGDARTLNLPAGRFDENQIRPAGVLLNRLLALDPAPVTTARDPGKRVVGTCRHFAVLSCALLRHRGIAARVRCGFATYFQTGYGLDHWITEYRVGANARWIRIDSEILGQNVLPHAHDLRPGDFLSGGEAWLAHRRGEIDASRFGVHGTQNWGASEIRGNAVKDLAAMNKVEMLPWDEWCRMTDAYDGKTGADYDLLLDDIAEVCAADVPVAVRSLYGHNDLRVPDGLIR